MLDLSVENSRTMSLRVNKRLYELMRKKAQEMGISLNRLVNLLMIGFLLGASMGATVVEQELRRAREAREESKRVNVNVNVYGYDREKEEARRLALETKAEVLFEEAERVIISWQRVMASRGKGPPDIRWWSKFSAVRESAAKLRREMMELLDEIVEHGCSIEVIRRLREYLHALGDIARTRTP